MGPGLMYDPLKLSEIIEEKVVKKVDGTVHRKYYRFRPAKFYGGIASADCCGCNLRCHFCWSNDPAREGKTGEFYSAEEVADKMVKIAEKFDFKQMRITGNEPTIGKEHLLSVLENIPPKYSFILETNGILLGSDESYVKALKKFSNLHVRVSLKGCTEEEFSKLTGAVPEAFQLQLNALKLCIGNGISCHPAVLFDLIEEKNMEVLRNRLNEIDGRLGGDLEVESLIAYLHVMQRLKKACLLE